jgi:hypothetical protein
MIEQLLGPLLGGVLRLVPEALKIFSAKRDADHEYRMTLLQLEIDKARAEQQIDLAHAQGAIAANTVEMAAMVEALRGQGVGSGSKRLDAINASVRPMLTYWWCVGLYSAYKGVAIAAAAQGDVALVDLTAVLVSEFDQAVIGSIVSFWFVDRSLRRGRL